MAHIQAMQTRINLLQQGILMNALYEDQEGKLYEWMKSQYCDRNGHANNVLIHSMIHKFKRQEKANQEELKYIDDLYLKYIDDYLSQQLLQNKK